MGKDRDDAVAVEVNRNRRLWSVLRKAGVVTVLIVIGVGGFAMTAALAKPGSGTNTNITPAHDQYAEKCNSGRGNSSETDTSQLVDPHNGETGPGIAPTVDCDPGNSGAVNHGGD